MARRSDKKTKKAFLSLGWQVTSFGDPSYWLRPGVKPGAQNDSDLVTVAADAMVTHTVIVAQSGSGKSLFLGRLVEELLLKTKAQCLILDPNGDFRKVHEVEDEKLWKHAAYDPQRLVGKVPTEARRER